MIKNKARFTKSILIHLFLLAAVVISIFPFVWMLTGATNSSVDITKGVMSFGKNLKENWENLQATADVLRVFFNTAITTNLFYSSCNI